MKPIFKILILVALLALLGLGIYLVWNLVTGSPASPTPAATSTVAGLPSALPSLPSASGTTPSLPTSPVNPVGGTQATQPFTLQRISKFPAFDFWISSSTQEIYYLTLDGKVLLVREGPDEEILSQPISALNRIQISSDGKEVLASFGDPHAPSWGVFDVIDKAWHPLPAGISEATWGVSSTIVYGFLLSPTSSIPDLIQIDVSKSVPTTKVVVPHLALQDVFMERVSTDTLLLTERPALGFSSRAWLLNIRLGTMNLLMNPTYGLMIGPSRDHATWFESVSQGRFMYADAKFQNTVPTVFTTLPSKCDASEQSVYCFIPRDFSQETPAVAFPDDYFKGRFFSVDDLVILTKDSLVPARHVISSPIDTFHPWVWNGAVYFVNRTDHFLYRVTLPQ